MRFHRITPTRWYYKKVPIQLAQTGVVQRRLNSIHDERNIHCSSPEQLNKDDILYMKLNQTGGLVGAEYLEYIIRLHRNGQTYDLAHGNSLNPANIDQTKIGFLNCSSSQIAFRATCMQELGRANMDFQSSELRGGWSREEARSIKECSRGRAFLQSNNSSIDLDLQFPSRNAEGSVKAQKIYVRRDGKNVAFAMRNLTPLFEKGFRFGLWFKHEVPFLYLNESVSFCDVLWKAVLVAAAGIIGCYRPAAGSSS